MSTDDGKLRLKTFVVQRTSQSDLSRSLYVACTKCTDELHFKWGKYIYILWGIKLNVTNVSNTREFRTLLDVAVGPVSSRENVPQTAGRWRY